MNKMIANITFSLLLLVLFSLNSFAEPMRIGVAGLAHGHIHGFFRQPEIGEMVQIVGVFEKDTELRNHIAERYQIEDSLLFDSLDTMLKETQPEAVVAFSSTFDHKDITVTCAEYGVHVMMEKPLAVSMEHANMIKEAAEKHNIKVMVNYETTWYNSNHAVKALVEENTIGPIRKVIVRDGHSGPKEIGCSQYFLAWLTDPILNGGGALFDFGCYGANLMTWLMNNERPISVTAITQTIKPDIYPNVDDEATIILKYPEAQAILQASWNWPFNRKDMDVYGKSGYAKALNANDVILRTENSEEPVDAKTLEAPYHSYLPYFVGIVRGEIENDGLSSLENNMIVTEILTAARDSANSGSTIKLD